MLTVILVGLIGLSWAAAGVAMVTAPAWWQDRTVGMLMAPLSRFLLTQGMVLGGLILILGTSHQQGVWLWGMLGALLVAKALVLLGMPEPLRARLIEWWRRSPAWSLQLAGVLQVALATLLVIDTWRGWP
ncbi:MAG: hypothetical protein FJ249_10410 [Nitrospira sp.]|nr:hypothetical protein [Nitrospira sp.]